MKSKRAAALRNVWFSPPPQTVIKNGQFARECLAGKAERQNSTSGRLNTGCGIGVSRRTPRSPDTSNNSSGCEAFHRGANPRAARNDAGKSERCAPKRQNSDNGQTPEGGASAAHDEKVIQYRHGDSHVQNGANGYSARP